MSENTIPKVRNIITEMRDRGDISCLVIFETPMGDRSFPVDYVATENMTVSSTRKLYFYKTGRLEDIGRTHDNHAYVQIDGKVYDLYRALIAEEWVEIELPVDA
jgi:hypothetical protein